MARSALNGVLKHIRSVAAVHTHRTLSDHELLERFVSDRDEASFTVLIERHGPMVLGVCRRILPSFHDAEDACQATFLVLARKAASIRKKQSLSSWLHGVACRVAANLKRDHVRRKVREREAAAPSPTDPACDVTWREVQTILDEELERLPDRYRAPLILCYLECLTRDEAARQLGLSSTTLHGRLERARDLLRDRLARRGLTLAAVISAAALGEGAVRAALAPTFVVSSTRAALLLTAGQPLAEGIVATHVLSVTQEVLKSMFLTKLKIGGAALLCACFFVALIGGSFASLGIAQDAPGPLRQKLATLPAKAESDTDFIKRISKDLRGTDPTPTEIYFFVTSQETGRRQKLIDLFIQERQAKKTAANSAETLDGGSVLIGQLKGLLESQNQAARAAKEGKDLGYFPPAQALIEKGSSRIQNGPAPDAGAAGITVEIRPRASGYVVKVACKPGSEVKKGDVLLEIDPRPYKAKLDAAQASVEQSQAALAAATVTSKRLRDFNQKPASLVSAAELEQSHAQEAKAKADLRLAEANRELARLELESTTIRAPIDGKIGPNVVSEGTLAVADKTVLATIVQVKKLPK
jgi:RNA polymerase sigma factor (sigma-70 family)